MSQMPEPPPPSSASPPPTSAYVESDTEFHRQARQPPRWDDGRRYPRFPFRARVEATILPLEGNEGQGPEQCAMLTRDLSRGGINLLHSDQLFPGQRIEIFLNGMQRCVEVRWCRRLANRCYSAGCRFVARKMPPSDPPAAAP
jgi:hypothetical protein